MSSEPLPGSNVIEPNVVEPNVVEPSRPTVDEVAVELADHVRALAGPDAVPRPEQLAAVSAVVAERRRTLLVARTGFGKSAVYFSATRMLRDRGWGPTLVVSPLLALMRDQVAAAEKLGLRAETINSSNVDAWDDIEAAIEADTIDLLLIAPERFANAGFRERVFHSLLQRPFALVCDEAHCISDWGHDFRPDYLRLRRLLDELPAWTPVLATTATANQRVTDDVASQLGNDTKVLRTSLDRESLHLSLVELDTDAQRWAWICERLSQLDGSGIIYTLTVDQAEQLASWLLSQGHAVAAYSGSTDTDTRIILEEKLRANELKALVATSALGMGFDKSDMAFCIHLGMPPTPVAYYQQIGRAGRGIPRAEVIAIPRPGDDQAVWRWFEQVSLPPKDICDDLLKRLSPERTTSLGRLETTVNLGRTRLQTLLSILEVHGAIAKGSGGWRIVDPSWDYGVLQADRLKEMRREESDQMRAFARLETCRLKFLRERLDDPDAADCGRCDVCLGTPAATHVDPSLVESAQLRLRGGDIAIDPRRQWPSGLDEPKGRIAAAAQNQLGRALCRSNDGGWAPIVERLLAGGRATDEPDPELIHRIVQGVVGVLRRWEWEERPTWICPMPSRRNEAVINAIAAALGEIGKLPVHHALVRAGDGGWQSEQSNSAHQVSNVWGRIGVDASALPPSPVGDGPVLVLDDTCSSRWTLTVVGHLLRSAGTGPILPIVLRLD
ncbi:MAG: ATP-dependent DNA helicase RecQ [Candidatus Poriferisodalaceae bacterium]|jgi:ATP-dependent DNA helicase RecQ